MAHINRHQVDQREDEHPDQINEVPVKTADLHILVPHTVNTQRDPRQIDYAREDVEHVQSRDCEEGRAEERRRFRPAMCPLLGELAAFFQAEGAQPLVYQMLPLDHVQDEKGQSADDSAEYPEPYFAPVLARRRRHSHHHRQARREQAQGHDGREDDTGIERKGRRPLIARSSDIAVSHQERREGQRIRDDKEPHPKLFMSDVIGQRPAAPFARQHLIRSRFSAQLLPPEEKE